MDPTLNPSIRALLARGISSDLAHSLVQGGYILSKLQSMPAASLLELRLNQDNIAAIHKDRPPIPATTLSKLLFDNKWVCCVCRDPKRPITVHHIDHWSKSHSHAASNLVVLCRIHHDEAHTTSTVRKTLTAVQLKECKESWETQVKVDDSVVVRKAAQSVGEYWYFFNTRRLHEIAKARNLNFRKLRSYSEAKARNLLSKDNEIQFNEAEPQSAYLGADCQTRYAFMRELFEVLLEDMSIVNISDRMDRSDLGGALETGDLIYIQGAHTFRLENPKASGPGQIVKAARSANSVLIEFAFDRWLGTSVSACTVHLSGRSTVASFCRVSGMENVNGKLIIKCSVLAICNEAPSLSTRFYGGYTLAALIAHRGQNDDDISRDDPDDWLDD